MMYNHKAVAVSHNNTLLVLPYLLQLDNFLALNEHSLYDIDGIS